MKKHLLSFTVVTALFTTVLPGCSKDDDDTPSETKSELLVKSTWKYDKAEAAPVGDISSYLEACVKDNLLTFSASTSTAVAGEGVIDEGPTKCEPGDPQSGPLNWALLSEGTVLRLSVVLLPGGSSDFNIETLNANNLVLSQQMTLSGLPVTVKLTLKH